MEQDGISDAWCFLGLGLVLLKVGGNSISISEMLRNSSIAI